MRQTFLVWIVIRVFSECLGDFQIAQDCLSVPQIFGHGLQSFMNISNPFVIATVAEDLGQNVLASVCRQLAPISSHDIETFQ